MKLKFVGASTKTNLGISIRAVDFHRLPFSEIKDKWGGYSSEVR